MLIDHAFMSFVGFILVIIPLYISMSQNSTIETWPILALMCFYLAMGIYFNKDIIGGKSIAKRIMGFRIVKLHDHNPASEFQLFIRNILIPLWPIEVIMSIISPSRKIGDFLAGTILIKDEKETIGQYLSEIKSFNFTGKTAFVSIITILYLYVIHLTMP